LEEAEENELAIEGACWSICEKSRCSVETIAIHGMENTAHPDLDFERLSDFLATFPNLETLKFGLWNIECPMLVPQTVLRLSHSTMRRVELYHNHFRDYSSSGEPMKKKARNSKSQVTCFSMIAPLLEELLLVDCHKLELVLLSGGDAREVSYEARSCPELRKVTWPSTAVLNKKLHIMCNNLAD